MTKKNTKRALMLSCLSMLLCVTMLVGSTFAWFTDTATTAVNSIKSGVIDIRLVDPVTGESLEGKGVSFVDKNGNKDILWEPGATFYSEPVRVMNHSNLSFYLDVFITGFAGDLKLLEAIDFKIVYASSIVEGYTWDQLNGRGHLVAGTGTSLTGEGKNGNNWMAEYYGLQSDRTAEDGYLGGYLGYAIDPSTLTPGTPKPLMDICIVGHMKEEAGNEYQGLTLSGAGLTFSATQAPYEYDSYEFTYDKDAEFATVVGTKADLDAALATGEDLTIGGGVFNNVTINVDTEGQTVTIGNAEVVAPAGNGFIVLGDGEVVVNGGTYEKHPNSSGVGLFYGAGGELVINGGTFDLDCLTLNNNKATTITITGGTFNLTNGIVAWSFAETCTISGGTFNQNPADWGNIADGCTVIDNGDGTWTVA